jgi:integrase
MTQEVFHGKREPVFTGNRRVRGLWQRKTADGSLVFEARLRLDGRDVRVVLEAKTKTDAIRELESVRVDRDRGEQRHRSLAPTMEELAAEWLEHLEARVGIRDERRRYSARTVALYQQRLHAHVLDRLGRRRVDELTVDDLRRLVDRLTAKGLAPGTVTSVVNIVSGLLRYAVKRKLVAHNPVRDLDRDDRPGVQRQSEPRYLSADELERLFAEMGDTFRGVALVCTYCGLRISEALGLRWRDVDLKAGTIDVTGQLGAAGERLDVTKTSSARATLTALPVLVRALTEHRARQAARNLAFVRPDALVFVTSRGKPQSRRNALRAVQQAGDAAGLSPEGTEKVGLHDLRHSLAAAVLERGGSLAELASVLRHANARVSAQVYSGLTDTARAEVASRLAATGFGA